MFIVFSLRLLVQDCWGTPCRSIAAFAIDLKAGHARARPPAECPESTSQRWTNSKMGPDRSCKNQVRVIAKTSVGRGARTRWWEDLSFLLKICVGVRRLATIRWCDETMYAAFLGNLHRYKTTVRWRKETLGIFSGDLGWCYSQS